MVVYDFMCDNEPGRLVWHKHRGSPPTFQVWTSNRCTLYKSAIIINPIKRLGLIAASLQEVCDTEEAHACIGAETWKLLLVLQGPRLGLQHWCSMCLLYAVFFSSVPPVVCNEQ